MIMLAKSLSINPLGFAEVFSLPLLLKTSNNICSCRAVGLLVFISSCKYMQLSLSHIILCCGTLTEAREGDVIVILMSFYVFFSDEKLLLLYCFQYTSYTHIAVCLVRSNDNS
jgi:hypothetical protein